MSITFANPWLLGAILLLPILWLLMRLIPPPARVVRFPGVRLLLGLSTREQRPESAPRWLRLLRMLALLLIVLGLADPILDAAPSMPDGRPVVILMDGGWASAGDWALRKRAARDLLAAADRARAPVQLAVLAQAPDAKGGPEPRAAAAWRPVVEGLSPAPWPPQRAKWRDWVAKAAAAGAQVHWFHDGLDHGAGAAFAAALSAGAVTVHSSAGALRALDNPRRLPEGAEVRVLRFRGTAPETVRVEARDGDSRLLGATDSVFAEGSLAAGAAFTMPRPVANRIASFRIVGERSAAAIRLPGDGWRRLRVGIATGGSTDADQPLLSGAHFVRSALVPVAELIEGEVEALLSRAPHSLVLVDRGELSDSERTALSDWVESGGQLIRFAGPRMAQWNQSADGAEADSLLPVATIPGGRNLGGALSWGKPQALAAFDPAGPFAGLRPSPEATVSRQLLAAPDARLGERSWARLEDGTPIVTGAPRGEGEVILFHTTADTTWSLLPLSGVFAEMLERVVSRAGGAADTVSGGEGLWMLETAVDGFGAVVRPPAGLAPVAGALLGEGRASPMTPPGIYRSGGARQSLAVSAADAFARGPMLLPGSAAITPLAGAGEREAGAWLLALALLLLAIEAMLTGELASKTARRAAMGAAVVLIAILGRVEASEVPGAVTATTLAYVLTGDSALDRTSKAGLVALGTVLAERTHVEPAPPQGIDPATDDLSLYPLIYWPIGDSQPPLADRAVTAFNRYLSSGGMLILDSRDQGLGGDGFRLSRRNLARLAGGLDLPPLALAGSEHVLTRTFYLLSDFPGRWSGGRIWVAGNANSEWGAVNDDTSPVIVGGADWAAAWAQDEQGRPLAAMGAGGELQREMAFRAGVNFVMYALLGNYKSDLVHQAAILSRLEN